jgi:hypothetical protein
VRRAALLVIALACAPNPDARSVETMPDRASFPPVADLLVHRCGTLDCHGQTSRNMRLYGHLGLRLAPGDRPNSKGTSTNDEYEQSFASIVGLEPEIMTAVVSAGGAQPDRLTFVRKARGAENHKGGTLFVAGDPQDRCVTSWLAGATDVATCTAADKSTF